MAERLNAATLARHPDTGAMVFLPAGSVPPQWAAGRLGAHLFGDAADTAGPGPERRRLRRARSAEHAAGSRTAERRDSSPEPRAVGPDREANPDPEKPTTVPTVTPEHEADPAPEPEPAPPEPFTEPEPAPEPDEVDPASTSPEPPPRHGRGASASAWRAWAADAGVPHDPDASRDEIIAAATAAGALTA